MSFTQTGHKLASELNFIFSNCLKVTIRGFNDEIINFNRLLTRYPLPRLETLVLEQDRIEFLNLTNFNSLKRLSLNNNALRDVQLPLKSKLEVENEILENIIFLNYL